MRRTCTRYIAGNAQYLNPTHYCKGKIPYVGNGYVFDGVPRRSNMRWMHRLEKIPEIQAKYAVCIWRTARKLGILLRSLVRSSISSSEHTVLSASLEADAQARLQDPEVKVATSCAQLLAGSVESRP